MAETVGMQNRAARPHLGIQVVAVEAFHIQELRAGLLQQGTTTSRAEINEGSTSDLWQAGSGAGGAEASQDRGVERLKR